MEEGKKHWYRQLRSQWPAVQTINVCIGCGPVGTAVDSNTRDWQFESSHGEVLFFISCIKSVLKDENKEKRYGELAI